MSRRESVSSQCTPFRRLVEKAGGLKGVAMRLRVRMTPRLIERTAELYEQGWSTVQIGKELERGTSTVGKTLKRTGVEMRPPVAELNPPWSARLIPTRRRLTLAPCGERVAALTLIR